MDGTASGKAEQNLHQVFGLYIHMTVAMTTDGMDHFFAHAAFMLLLSLTTKLII